MRIEYPTPSLEGQLQRLWQDCFGDSPAFTARYFEDVYAPERCRCVLMGDDAAAALHWLDGEFAGERYAYLYAVATHPDFRRRGLCRALLEDTCALLAREGYAGALLMPAGDALRQSYAAMGWKNCCTWTVLTASAGRPVPLKEVGLEEYARLRRAYLPRNGMLQEGENLSYLRFYAQTYAGEDFLLAAVQDGGVLTALELLGSRKAAPGILAALGCERGTFRLPGGENQGAMLRRLKADAPEPGYFGLTFE